jgi:hypothetical protein
MEEGARSVGGDQELQGSHLYQGQGDEDFGTLDLVDLGRVHLFLLILDFDEFSV